MAFEYVGTCRIYGGNPNTALGADMHDFGFLEDVVVDIGVQFGWTSNAQLAGVPNSAEIFALPSQPRIQAQIRDGSIANLQKLMPGGVFTTDAGPPVTEAFGFGNSFATIDPDDLPTIVLIPGKQRGSGSSATQAIWLPKALIQGLNGFTFNRPAQGELGNPYNAEIIAAYCETDEGSNAIPEGYRTGWIGDPAAIGLTYSLPSGA